MRTFALAYPDEIGSQPVTQLPWGHIVTLIHTERMRREIEAEKDKPLSQRRYQKIDPKILDELLEIEEKNRKHSIYG